MKMAKLAKKRQKKDQLKEEQEIEATTKMLLRNHILGSGKKLDYDNGLPDDLDEGSLYAAEESDYTPSDDESTKGKKKSRKYDKDSKKFGSVFILNMFGLN